MKTMLFAVLLAGCVVAVVLAGSSSSSEEDRKGARRDQNKNINRPTPELVRCLQQALRQSRLDRKQQQRVEKLVYKVIKNAGKPQSSSSSSSSEEEANIPEVSCAQADAIRLAVFRRALTDKKLRKAMFEVRSVLANTQRCRCQDEVSTSTTTETSDQSTQETQDDSQESNSTTVETATDVE